MGVPGQSGRSFDIVRQVVGNVVNIFNKRPPICTAPCDGMVLRMHYQWTFWMLLGSFTAIWYSWFNRDVITCASHFNADTQVRLDYVNICLSYPFLEDGKSGRRYILYYRWIHWVLLLLAMIYYIPRKMSKNSDNAKVKKLFEDLAGTATRYDSGEKEQVERTARYFVYNLRTHDGLFYKYLTCHFIALLIDLFAFYFLDFVFQGRFRDYVVSTYPFKRDVEYFKDYMSQTFPPFVLCELGETYQLTNKRHETLGCHLTVMELYEKIFFVLWIWLVLLIAMTTLYIIYLFLFILPSFRLFILRISKPVAAKNRKIREAISESITDCKIGDVYVLYRLRQHFSHARFYELLCRISDPGFIKLLLESVSIDYTHPKENPDLRQRNKVQTKSPGKFIDGSYNKLPNTSILVE
ncbi:UNVERIFIED_CONTAM: hypothetical protein RMT77_009276 [Armadillidium vulgare]